MKTKQKLNDPIERAKAFAENAIHTVLFHSFIKKPNWLETF